MPRLSVVISTYNDSKYLDKILRNYAILQRSHEVKKIIVVSDGSDSQFVDLLKHSIEEDSLLILDQNVGSHRARMAAVELIDNGFCLFLDSDDDLIEPFAYVGPGLYDFLGFNMSTSVSTYEHGQIDDGNKLSRQIINNKASGVLWNKVYDIEFLRQVPVVPLRNGEDYFTCLWMRNATDLMVHYKKPLLQYNVRSNSLSKRPNKEKYRDLVKMIKILGRNKKITLVERLKLYWNLVILNFVRSLKNSDKANAEIKSLLEVFRCR